MTYPNTRPGACYKATRGEMCEAHPDEKATVVVQGETDSFGCEYAYLCAECEAARQLQLAQRDTLNAEAQAFCEVGNHLGWGIQLVRDPDEGNHGRLYSCCTECRVLLLSKAGE